MLPHQVIDNWRGSKFFTLHSSLFTLHSSLLECSSDVEDDYCADDGRSELTEQTAPCDAECFKYPSAKSASEEPQQQIHQETEATAFH